ncbi:MAG: DUF5652 family protein [Nanoarchaeota archaeon]
MALNYLTDISVQLGIPLILLVILLIWEIVWKLIAMWKAARNNSPAWFIALAIINSVGILPILYIFGFSKLKKEKKTVKKKKSRRR